MPPNKFRKNKRQVCDSSSYKQKDISPSTVIKGRAAVLDISHFSLDFLTPHINKLVYKKKIIFKLTPNIPRYNGILHEE